MKFGIANKINLLIIAIIVMFGFLLGAYMAQNQRKTLNYELDKRVNALITNLSMNSEYPVLVRDRAAIEKLVKGILAQKDIIYCRVSDSDGATLYEEGSEKGPYTKVFTSLIMTQETTKSLGEDLVLGAAKEEMKQEAIGNVYLVVSLAEFRQKAYEMGRMIFFVIITFIIVASLASSLLLKFVLDEPIKHLVLGTKRVASGDLNHQVSIKTTDEIGQLAFAFNKMTEDLQRTVVSKDYVDNIIRSMIDMLIVLNPDGTIRTVNKATLDLLGYKEEELIGQPVEKICPAESSSETSPIMLELINKVILSGVEKVYRAKDGSHIPVLLSGSVMYGDDNRVQGIVCVALDVTERKLAEEALRKSEERYRRLFDTAPDLIYCISAPDGLITSLNPAFEKLTGWQRDEWVGKPFTPLVHPDDVSVCIDRFKQVLQGNNPPPYELRLRDKSGDYLVGEFTSVPQVEDGRIIGKFGIMRDITERKHAEKEKEKLQSQLMQQSKLAAVGQLAGGVAHEINNPMGVILGFSQSLVKRIKDDDPFAMPLKSIEREAARCKRLVGDLLTFSRVGKTQSELTDISKAIDETLSLVETKAKMKGVEIIRKYGDGLPQVLANRNQIQQVIMNLCNNAMDAMPQGGKLTITTQLLEGFVGIGVQDTGEGMTNETKQRIFEPFFTTKEVGKGTGLGLSLCYEIIQRHNGTIEVESETGRGTNFILKLPLKEC